MTREGKRQDIESSRAVGGGVSRRSSGDGGVITACAAGQVGAACKQSSWEVRESGKATRAEEQWEG